MRAHDAAPVSGITGGGYFGGGAGIIHVRRIRVCSCRLITRRPICPRCYSEVSQ